MGCPISMIFHHFATHFNKNSEVTPITVKARPRLDRVHHWRPLLWTQFQLLKSISPSTVSHRWFEILTYELRKILRSSSKHRFIYSSKFIKQVIKQETWDVSKHKSQPLIYHRETTKWLNHSCQTIRSSIELWLPLVPTADLRSGRLGASTKVQGGVDDHRGASQNDLPRRKPGQTWES